MSSPNDQNLWENKKEGQKLLIYLCFILLVGVFTFYPHYPLIWWSILILSLVFILPIHYYLGLPLIIILTILFERAFTLQGLIFDHFVYKIYPLDIIMGTSFLALFISAITEKIKIKIKFGWPEWLLIIFMIINLIYLIGAWLDINSNLEIAFSSFKNYTWYSLIYFFILLTIKNSEDFKKNIHIILISGAIIIVYLLFGLMKGQGLWTEYMPLSTPGVRYLSGTYAFYMLLCLILGISLLAFKRLGNSAFAAIIALFWILGIILSLMRHLWLDTIISLILLFLLLPQENKRVLSYYARKFSLIIISAFAFILLITELLYLTDFNKNFYKQTNNLLIRANSLINIEEDQSANWRLQFWYDAKKVWEKTPLLGVGLGKSVLIDTGDWQNFEAIRNLHNSWLAILIQFGIVGFLLFLSLIIVSAVTAFKTIYQFDDLLPYYLGLLVGCATFLFASLFQPYLETNLMAIFFWIFLGLLRTANIIKENENTSN